MKKIKLTVMCAALLLVLALCLPACALGVAYDWESDRQGVAKYERVIKVAANKDYCPFTYLENGKPSGHDVELLYEIARRMKVNVELSLIDWASAVEGIKSGEYDALLTLTYTEARAEYINYSNPITVDPYIAFGKGKQLSVTELAYKK